jgi:hypothetical protein
MKDTAEIARLRTLLRNVNRDYSALLRETGQEDKLTRLEALKGQRLALMSRIAELRRREAAEALPATWHSSERPVEISQTGTLSALMLMARTMAAAVGVGWFGGNQSLSRATAVPPSE